jgi:hypothetical protein
MRTLRVVTALGLMTLLVTSCAGPSATTTAPAVSLDPSGEIVGVVPPDSMSLAVNNTSSLTVSLVVNGTLIASLDPGTCLGCNENSAVPASLLPPLPWKAEVRSPSGRVLLSLTVHAGDVANGNSSAQGDGARVDLSCGRIDLWSGPPMLGPAPGPGSPGDCRP